MSIWVKRGISIIALAVVLYLFWPLLKELRAAVSLFTTAHWSWLPAVLLLQFVSYSFLTWLNDLALQPFEGKIHFLKLMALLTSMAFIESAIPSAGASGVALRARLLGKTGGYSLEASTFTLALESIFIVLAIITVSLFGLAYLIRSGELSIFQIVAMSLAGVIILSLVWGSWRLLQDRPRTHRLLAGLARRWNRWLGRFRRVDLVQMEERLEVFQTGLDCLRQTPRWMFFLAAYLRVLLDVATLGACFLMFGYPITIGELLTGYGLILSASLLASLPGGLGMADLSIPALFLHLGVAGPVALAAGITYRLIAFWLVRFIGFISWQYLEAAH